MKYQILFKSFLVLLLMFFVSSVANASGFNMYSPYSNMSMQNMGGSYYSSGYGNYGCGYNGWCGGSSAQGGGYRSSGIFGVGGNPASHPYYYYGGQGYMYY